jgi:hypothetical protein
MELSALQGELTKWFDIPGTSVRVKVKLPTRDELLKDHRAVVKKDGIGIDDMKWFRTVATKYIQDAQGITDNGNPVDYTIEIGLSLMRNQICGPFIDKMLGAAGEWLEEGNA